MTFDDDINDLLSAAIRMGPEGRWVEKEGVIMIGTPEREHRLVLIAAVGTAADGLSRILREHGAVDPRSTDEDTDA